MCKRRFPTFPAIVPWQHDTPCLNRDPKSCNRRTSFALVWLIRIRLVHANGTTQSQRASPFIQTLLSTLESEHLFQLSLDQTSGGLKPNEPQHAQTMQLCLGRDPALEELRTATSQRPPRFLPPCERSAYDCTTWLSFNARRGTDMLVVDVTIVLSRDIGNRA